MTQNASVLERLDRDIEEVTSTTRRANQVADDTTRAFLKWLLPNPRSLTKDLIESRGRTYQHAETVVSTFVDLLFRTDAWTTEVAKRRQQENAADDERRMKIEKVELYFDSLTYKDLVPLFLDYKLKDLDHVIQTWNNEYTRTQKKGLPKRAHARIIENNENNEKKR